MKALELTVYPHVIDGGMDCIIDHEGTMRFHRELDDFAADKCFTDAELAAEYQRGEFDYERAFHGMCYLSGNWNPDKFATHERRATLERFATLPHYDEAEQ